ncbi:hypothetical protein ACF061_23910 [Streptomyces sp. NPDC015220]|uniref:hypothetical protein n=1 Tax=Streptomyces sp. NPDC015220 TaxID=3364947 RepID=UPI0036F7DC32
MGALLGAALTDRLAHRVGLGRTLVIAAVVGDLAPLLLPAVHRGTWAAPLFAAAFFVQGFGITACNVHTMTIRQTVTPQRLLGRTNAAYLFVALGVKPVGSLLGGWLGTRPGLLGAASGRDRGAAEHQSLPGPVPAAQGPHPGQPQSRASPGDRAAAPAGAP